MSATPPTAVVFDLGKVLLDFDYGIAVRRLLPRCTAGAVEVQRLIDQSPLLFQYETGLITTAEFFEAIQRGSGFTGGLEEFVGAFADVFAEIPPMVALNRRLRAQGIPTYIFSNTNEVAIGHVRQRFPFFAEFHDYILSYEHRSMKPDAPLYEVVERRSGRKEREIFYVDDRPENIEAGRQRGWQTVLHTTSEPTHAAMRAAGLPV